MRKMWQGYASGNGGSIVNTAIADGANLDAFSRLRTSEAETLFDVHCAYNNDSLKLEQINTGDGQAPAYSTVSRLLTLQINAGAAGGESAVQSFQYVPYQPGKSQFIAITGVLGAATAGAVKLFGYGDTNNGIFYEQNGTNGLLLRIRSNVTGVVQSEVALQAQWNIDPLNGAGPSGLTINPENSFILIIDLQYLGMGRVRCGFDIGGEIVYAHEFNHANLTATTYMASATLPIYAGITAAAGLAGPATAIFKCAQVASEGGFESGRGRTFSCEGNVTAGSGTRTHCLSIRPRTTFNTIVNRINFILDSIEILAGNNAVYWELVTGGAFTAGPVWSDVDTTYSGFQKGVPASTWNAGSAPTVLQSGYVSTSAATRGSVSHVISMAYPVALDRAGAVRSLGTLHVLLTGLSGTSASRVAMNWTEIR